MHNQRNFYRLLHVQQDAPAAVIKASYRAMMQKLRYHPDLGGDEGDARLLNEAMATLGTPDSRAAYDRSLRGGTDGRDDLRASSGAPADGVRAAGAPEFGVVHCRFCQASRVATWTPSAGYESSSSCNRCGGPTRSVERFVASVSADRRRIDGRPRTGTATLWSRWPLEEPLVAELIDLSITGCALESVGALRTDRVVLLDTVALDAIAEVRSCRCSADGSRHLLRLTFLTVQTREWPENVRSSAG